MWPQEPLLAPEVGRFQAGKLFSAPSSLLVTVVGDALEMSGWPAEGIPEDAPLGAVTLHSEAPEFPQTSALAFLC